MGCAHPGLAQMSIPMNESDFPSELPCLADLPTAEQFRNDNLARWDEPGAEPLQILHAALAAYENSHRAYAACGNTYLRRREQLQQEKTRPAQRADEQQQDGRAGFQGGGPVDELAVRRLGLVDLRSLVVDSFLKARRDFDAVYVAHYAWDLLDTGSDEGRRTKAARDLKARLAAGIPTGQARQRVEMLRRRRRDDDNAGSAKTHWDEPERTTARNRPMESWMSPIKRR
jgi:hypothetical protein